MKRAAPYVKGWNPYFSAYEYPQLGPSAAHFGFEFAEPGWHDARADAQMTLKIWLHMESIPPFPVSSSIIFPHHELPVPINTEEACPLRASLLCQDIFKSRFLSIGRTQLVMSAT